MVIRLGTISLKQDREGGEGGGEQADCRRTPAGSPAALQLFPSSTRIQQDPPGLTPEPLICLPIYSVYASPSISWPHHCIFI